MISIPPRRNPKYRYTPIPSPVNTTPDIDSNYMMEPVEEVGYQLPNLPNKTPLDPGLGLPPDMLRALKAKRLTDLGAALLAQSGFHPVAPTLGEGFGNALRTLPDWSETVMNATAKMQELGMRQRKQMEESELQEFFQSNARQGNESAEQWMARLLPGLASLNSSTAREAAQSIMQTLSSLRDDLVDIGGHLVPRDPNTGDLDIEGAIPKTPGIGDLTAAARAVIADTEAEHKQFRDETQEDEIRAESWRQAWENNSPASLQAIREMDNPVASAVHDQIFLQSLLNALQPEAKINVLKGAISVGSNDTGVVKMLKNKLNSLLEFVAGGADPQEPMSLEDRQALLDTVKMYMQTASRDFGRKMSEFERRASARGLDFKQIGRDIYALPGLAERANQNLYDEGNRALQRPRRRGTN